MTQETRETLTELADELERVVLEVSSRDGDATARQHARAAALRDVLTPRTCGNCRHTRNEKSAQPDLFGAETVGPVLRRVWAMSSPDTFSIPVISQLLDRHLFGCAVVVDPFARMSRRGTITNDLNPAMPTTHHLPAEDFCQLLVGAGVQADAVLFDPPYSPRQITECYQSAGLVAGMRETQNARMYKAVKDGLNQVLKPGGIAISFGWNTSGFGRARGYEWVEGMAVAHGGAHNDTLVVVERKVR